LALSGLLAGLGQGVELTILVDKHWTLGTAILLPRLSSGLLVAGAR